jgi:hypothetical protein
MVIPMDPHGPQRNFKISLFFFLVSFVVVDDVTVIAGSYLPKSLVWFTSPRDI